MLLETDIDILEQEPLRRPCSVLLECDIEPGTTVDYKQLSVFHYRNTGIPPAIKAVYRAVHQPTGRLAGVIVYAMPALSLRIRNQIFGGAYTARSKADSRAKAACVNRDFELIIRVVIDPVFRGVGLGARLVGETLRLRRTKYVEMSAAMGAINPFAEKAGMTPYRRQQIPRAAERVLSALRSTGLSEDRMGNPVEICRHLHSMNAATRQFLSDELCRYELQWAKGRTNREVKATPETGARRVASVAMMTPVYYLWTNPNPESVVVPGEQV